MGAGLAGLAAACDLVDAGWAVTILEKRPFAGGKTYSFTDPQSGEELDNGQHVFMRCCTEYMSFLRRVGGIDQAHLQPRLRVPVVRRHGARSALTASRLPAPFHLVPSFLRYAHLSWGEKLAAARLLLRLQRLGETQRLDLDGTSFMDYLRANGQSDSAIESFWDLVTVPTLNGGAREVSASLAIMVFQVGLLSAAHNADLGLPAAGLSRLHVDPALRALEALGVQVRLRTSVSRLLLENGRAVGVETENAGPVGAEAVVLALPHTGVAALLPEELRGVRPFAQLSRLGVSPIVNLHAWYDREVMPGDFAAFLGTPIQWVFNRTRLWRRAGETGQHLAVSISAAHHEVALSKEELERDLLPELASLLPVARDARVLRTVVIKEPEATFAARPGSAALRPGPTTPVANLVLAGAYTATGWPATMESAVRSGCEAARALLCLPMPRAGESKSRQRPASLPTNARRATPSATEA